MVPDGFLCAFSPVLVGQHNVEGMGASSFPSHRFGTRGSEGVSAADTPTMKTRPQLQIHALPPCFTHPHGGFSQPGAVSCEAL